MKINTKGNQVFNVPNNDEGRTFIKLAQKFVNRNVFKTKNLGRGSRKFHGQQSFVPLQHSEWIAVYVKAIPKDTAKIHQEIMESIPYIDKNPSPKYVNWKKVYRK
jgi:hypothetical protein